MLNDSSSVGWTLCSLHIIMCTQRNATATHNHNMLNQNIRASFSPIFYFYWSIFQTWPTYAAPSFWLIRNVRVMITDFEWFFSFFVCGWALIRLSAIAIRRGSLQRWSVNHKFQSGRICLSHWHLWLVRPSSCNYISNFVIKMPFFCAPKGNTKCVFFVSYFIKYSLSKRKTWHFWIGS